MVHLFSTFELDEELFELREHGHHIPVQPKVLELLIFLVRERERVVQKQEIMAAIWPDVVVGEGSLARAAMAARRAIRDEQQAAIVTVRGRGLRFVLDVTTRGKKEGSSQNETQAPRPAPTEPTDVYAGREREDAALSGWLSSAEAGEGSVVWLTGEAGMGKTRTADQLSRVARSREVMVLHGRCHESSAAPPYRPWVQLARSWLASVAPADREQVTRAVSELLPDVVPEATDVARVVTDDALRFRLYDAFVQRLAQSARKKPILIVLEDLQRADASSLSLLSFLAREIRELPIFVVATLRDNEIDAAIITELGALLTTHGSHSMALHPLGEADVKKIAEAYLAKQLDDLLAAKMYEKSGGNPLYVRELLESQWLAGALVRTGNYLRSTIDVRAGLRTSIVRHLGALSDECMTTLTAASLLGARFELPVLSAVTSLAPPVVVDQLEEAVRARIVVREGLSRFRFLHALVRDVLYQRLPAGERFTLHRATADALLLHWGESADDHLGEVAMHLVRAAPGGDAERAVAVAERAAELAKSRRDWPEAVSLYERAIEALSFVRGAPAARLAELRSRLEESKRELPTGTG